jgi:hypothetical protein
MNSPNTSCRGTGSSTDSVLRDRFDRLAVLRSAWGVLAPSGLAVEKQDIGETGRTLSDDLAGLFGTQLSSEELAEIDARIDSLEGEMRGVALKVPVVQLRSTLPEVVAVDRRGVLDLLDLVLGAEIAGLGGIEDRIGSIDYLITILCTGGAGDSPLHDPVTLTPRLFGLCQQSDIGYDERLPALEAEFFAAADMHQADARHEVGLRKLRRRKMELGSAFFAPGVLRAIVTYNAALLKSIDQHVLDSLYWGARPAGEESDVGGSVFESPAIPALAEAVRRRVAGAPPGRNPLDRVAWCVDLGCLSKSEMSAMRAKSVGPREDLVTTTILVGLLCRSAVALDNELPAIGISPALLSGAWTEELDQTLQQEATRNISEGNYQGACVFTDLKSKFLSQGMVEVRRKNRSEAPARRAPARAEPDRVREEAWQISQQALEAEQAKPEAGDRRSWPWEQLAWAGSAVGAVLLALGLAKVLLWDAGRLAGDELEQLSPYLSSGLRNADGSGSSFVGKVDSAWFELADAEQTRAAEALVGQLRSRGVSEIMVYDRGGRLRIQALGSQAPRVVGAGD